MVLAGCGSWNGDMGCISSVHSSTAPDPLEELKMPVAQPFVLVLALDFGPTSFFKEHLVQAPPAKNY
jgi:hypothetical protein